MKTTRRIVQFGFLTLTLVGVFVVKGNAERWCPFGGVEAIYTYATEGNMLCSLGVSNFYILGALLLITLLLRRAFCGYACPIGTLSEWLGAGAARLGFKPRSVPYRLDRGLAKLKYVVLVVILYFTWTYAELEFRVADPCYALLSRHGEDITFWAYVVAGAVVIGSLLVIMPFCRWLCPLAAVMHPLSRFGFTRVKRDEETCIDCGLCSKVCPTGIPVDKVDEVKAARCMSCLNCVTVCPRDSAGAISWGPPKAFGRSWPQAALIGIILVCFAAAVGAAYALPIPSFTRVVEGRGDLPAESAIAELEVYNLSCRGRASLFAYFVERDDVYELPGYLKIEAWPGPGAAPVHITFDPTQTDPDAISEAIMEPYYDAVSDIWRSSPFEVSGYDPLGLDGDTSEGEQPSPGAD